MHILKPDEIGSDDELTGRLRDQGMALSMLAGVRPGVAAVNDRDMPTALCLGAPEGTFAWTYLAGDPNDSMFRKELRAWIFDEHGLGPDVAFSFLTADRPEWEEALSEILAPRTVIPDRRLHYETVARPDAWRQVIPEGYEIVDVDRGLLDSDVPLHEKLSEWFVANFGSIEGFLEHGVGAVAVHEKTIVGWILADSFVGGLSDIGGEVEEDHRRKGLAYAATCRTVELALERGAERIGWHCHEINLPSIKTAEAAGFELKYGYTVYPIHFDPEKHEKLVGIIVGELAEAGDAALAAGNVDKADESYTALFGLDSAPSADRLPRQPERPQESGTRIEPSICSNPP